MSDPTNRDERRAALAEAKAKLEARRKAREQLKAAREERQRAQGNANNFGRQYVENFMKIIKETEKQQQTAARKGRLGGSAAAAADDAKSPDADAAQRIRSKYRAPGRRRILEMADYTIIPFKDEKKVEMYDKEIGVDPIVFDEYLVDILNEDFNEEIMTDAKERAKIVGEFMISQDSDCWPPDPTNRHGRSLSVGAGLLKPLANVVAELGDEAKAEWEMMEEEAKEEEVFLLPHEEANALINSGNFLDNLGLKAKWMERALGINEEMAFAAQQGGQEGLVSFEDLSFDMSESVTKGVEEIRSKLKIMESEKKNRKDLLLLKKQFINNRFEGRPVGWIEFSTVNPDWFLSCYSRRGAADSFSSEPDGCIAIWNFVIPSNPEYLLYADSMVSTARFHPTHNSIIFGATLSGQILQWDIRTNNYSKPVARTNFAHGHSSPVFGMSFLPSMNSKNQHFVSVSNDGKVCMWRDDDLATSTSEIILKVDEADKQASLLMGGNAGSSSASSASRGYELGTNCFSYSVKEWNTMTFGSDEGNIYKAEIHGGGKAQEEQGKKSKSGRDQKSSAKKQKADGQAEYVNVLELVDHAHEGPITNICYNHSPTNSANTIQKQQLYSEHVSSLYLTSSFDWTVKLWHSKYHTRGPISIFDNMTDYVYDVKWSNVKPSVFACGDGNGKINLFNLNEDFNSPIGAFTVPKERVFGRDDTNERVGGKDDRRIKAVTKLEFTKNGKYLMAGDSDGMIHMYSIHRNLYTNEEDEFDSLVDKVQTKVKDFGENKE